MANKTRAQIASDIATLLADNTAGEISAEDIRSIMTDIKDSMINLSEDDYEDISGLVAQLNAKASATHSHVISDITGLQTELDAKLESVAISDVSGLQTELDDKLETVTVEDISDELVDIFLNDYDDSGLISGLSGSWVDDVITISGWDSGRFYKDANYLYFAHEENTVTRLDLGSTTASASSGFDVDSVLTRRITPGEVSEVLTTGADGDEYVTAATEALGSMTVSFDNGDPASNLGIKYDSSNSFWEVIGADNINIVFSSDSVQGNGDKNASPRTGPWFWYAVIEYAGTIGDDMIKMNANGSKGIKLETLSSKATIKVNSTMVDISDSSTTGGVSLSFKDNWSVGAKYLVAASKNVSGRNTAYLGTLSESTPGQGLEVRSTGQFTLDDFDNLDPANFEIKFKAGTKIYELGYMRGEADMKLVQDLFVRAKALIA